MSDAVDHPDYYGGEGDPFECIKVLEAWGLLNSFCIANAIKYLCRAGKKGPALEDLRKSRWYLDYEIRRLEKEAADMAD